ncbi:unnamed protein product [Arctogadus glacialis]
MKEPQKFETKLQSNETLATLRRFLSTPPSGSPPLQEGLSSDRTVPSTHLHIPSARGLIRRSQTQVRLTWMLSVMPAFPT